jgi:hypothetical protein
MRQQSVLAFALAGAIALLGCSGVPQSDYSQLGLVDAYGTITLDSKPLENAVVTFDAADGQFSYGLTDANGNYKLQLDSVKSGVTPGPKTVRISTTRKILGLNTTEGEGEADPGQKRAADAPKELVPEKYNKQSELKVEVTPDKREYNFDLRSVGE